MPFPPGLAKQMTRKVSQQGLFHCCSLHPCLTPTVGYLLRGPGLGVVGTGFQNSKCVYERAGMCWPGWRKREGRASRSQPLESLEQASRGCFWQLGGGSPPSPWWSQNRPPRNQRHVAQLTPSACMLPTRDLLSTRAKAGGMRAAESGTLP